MKTPSMRRVLRPISRSIGSARASCRNVGESAAASAAVTSGTATTIPIGGMGVPASVPAKAPLCAIANAKPVHNPATARKARRVARDAGIAVAAAPKLKTMAAISVTVLIWSNMTVSLGWRGLKSVGVPAPRVFVGGGSRRGAEARRRNGFAARAVDQYGIDRLAGLGVDDDDARPLGREMLVAP